MKFTEFLKEKEEESMNSDAEEIKAKVVAIFTEGEPVTAETITAKAEEFEMEKEELENEVYKVLFDMLNVEDDEGEEEILSPEDGENDMDYEEEPES